MPLTEHSALLSVATPINIITEQILLTEQETYIKKKSNLNLANSLAQKEYDLKVKHEIQHELHAIELFLRTILLNRLSIYTILLMR